MYLHNTAKSTNSFEKAYWQRWLFITEKDVKTFTGNK
jgi:hypothetical protein